MEGLGVWIADPVHGVPVGAAGRQRQRAAGGGAEQASLGIEDVEQWKEVMFVGAASVKEDERTLGRPGGGSGEVLDRWHLCANLVVSATTLQQCF